MADPHPPLDGVRVVDLGQYVAGPLAAHLLAEQGAEVLHIDPPGGPLLPGPATSIWNRHKQQRELDLRHTDDLAELHGLVASADVVIENFRPGALTAAGIDGPAATRRHPRLVYCSLPGFGHEDPRAPAPGWESVVAAATGTYRPPIDDLEGPPERTPLPISSVFAALTGATAVVAALLARERDQRGQWIEVPLFDATYTAMGCFALPALGGEDPRRTSDIWGKGLYRCADGRWVQLCTASPRFLEWLLEAAGCADEWRSRGLLDRSRMAREPHRLEELRRALTALFATRPAAAWEALDTRVPVTMVRTVDEWADSEAAGQAGVVSRRAGLRVTGPAATVERVVSRGVETAPSRAPVESGLPPLAGCRVLDLSQVLAGPVGGRILAEYGADVIKINDPDQAPHGLRYHVDVNRGKRTALLDLSDDADRERLLALVDDVDVVIHNFTVGVAERLGVGEEQLRRRNPALIHVWVTAFGTEGPWCERRGYEINAQAATGMMDLMADADAPRPQPFLVNDYGTGVLTAFAALVGLLGRERHGGGHSARTSLAHTAATLLTPFLNVSDASEPVTLRGRPPLRVMRAADGWLLVAGIDGDEPDGRASSADATTLAPRVAGQSSETAIGRPHEVGLFAQRICSLEEAIEDPEARSRGLIQFVSQPQLGLIRMVGPPATLTRTPLVTALSVGPAGADQDEVCRTGWRAHPLRNKPGWL